MKIFDTEPLTDCVLVLDFVGETVFETVCICETSLIDVGVTMFDMDGIGLNVCDIDCLKE